MIKWSRVIKCAFLSKNKIKFINGEIQDLTKTNSFYDT